MPPLRIGTQTHPGGLEQRPPSNAYLTEQTLHAPEKWFPLRVLVCTECRLAQTEDYAGAEDPFDDGYADRIAFDATNVATPQVLRSVSCMRSLGWQAKTPLRERVARLLASTMSVS